MRRLPLLLLALLVPIRAPAQTQPKNLSLAADDSAVLWWDANTEPDLAGYKIHYGQKPGTYTQVITIGKTTAYRVTGLAPGLWYFAITAYNATKAESGYSNEVSVQLLGALVVIFAIVDDATSSTARLVWKTSAPADGRVEYTYSGGPFSSLTVDSAAQKVTDHVVKLAGLRGNTVYSYTVISSDGTVSAKLVGTFRTR